MEQLSGPKRFWRFAFVCAESLLEAKKIEQDDFNELKSLGTNSDEPDTMLLAVCFTKPVGNLRRFAKFLGVDMWAPETVADFCYHSHGGNSPGIYATVTAINTNCVEVFDGKKTLKTLNIYQLILKVGDPVFVHLDCIVEKDE